MCTLPVCHYVVTISQPSVLLNTRSQHVDTVMAVTPEAINEIMEEHIMSYLTDIHDGKVIQEVYILGIRWLGALRLGISVRASY